MTRVFNVREAARALNVHPDTVRKLMKSGRLPYVKVAAHSTRISEDAIATLLRPSMPKGEGSEA